MRSVIFVVLGFMIALIGTSVEAQPYPKGTAADVTHTDIQDALKKTASAKVSDQQLRVVSINGEYNVAVGILHRAKASGKDAGGALEHTEVTEVYHIIEGSGTFVTGGDIENSKPLPANSEVVKVLVGPSNAGGPIDGGVSRKVGPGDVIILPPNTPHWFSEITTPEIVYLVVRVDSRKVLPAGYGAK